MKEELDGKKKKEFPALREKQYSCLTDNNDEDKKSKIKKKNPKFEDYQVQKELNLEKNKPFLKK